ncbi:MAG: hypothetical protein ACRC1T_12100 [Clostridium chrysemydis]|uniref:hypothetical protein n=1 Tax=Clostridium chrysemydis TaxID=2665504 RepID=UPI003F34F275
MNKEIIFSSGMTLEALDFFELNKESFGEVVKAEMESRKMQGYYKLTLQNNDGEKMIFNGGLSSGYQGEGCRGTLKVLNDCGFDIDIEYISNNPNFILEK